MKEIIFRKAKAGDRIPLDELFREELEYHRSLMPTVFKVPETVVSEEWLASILDNEDRFLVVSELEGRIVAVILYGVGKSPEDGIFRERHFGYIEELVITERLRRMGLGLKLLDHALSELGSLGLKDVEIHVWESNTMGLDFYGKHGFVTIRRRMRRTLDPR